VRRIHARKWDEMVIEPVLYRLESANSTVLHLQNELGEVRGKLELRTANVQEFQVR
jgi:hypothetical protein